MLGELIKTADVALQLGISDSAGIQPFVDTAHSLVAAGIGCDTLLEHTASNVIYPDNHRNLIILRDGPIASIASITSLVYGDSDTALDLDDIEVGKWTVRFKKQSTLFSAGTHYTVAFTAGYRAGNSIETVTETTPTRIKRALILTAAQLKKVPDSSITYEQIGDYSRKRESKTGSSAFLDEVKELLRDFRRPRL